jgi:hypothetical protein
MMLGKNLVVFATVCIVAWMGGSCGKEKGQAERPASKPGKTRGSEVANLAKQAMEPLSIDDEFIEGRQMVEGAGFMVTEYKEFPTEETAKRGRVLVYADKQKKQSGGVVYLKKTGGVVGPAWHWYFEDMVPDSVVNREINRDGLWDIRIVSSHGKVSEFVQGDSFTMFAPERSDWIAMNGKCSPPISGEFAMWKCFDGDTTTAWKSSVSGAPFIEVPVPFGVKDGILSLATLSSGQPDRCVVYADGNRVGEIEVKPVTGRQMIALGNGVTGAKKIRLEFPSVRGGGDAVAIAELGVK